MSSELIDCELGPCDTRRKDCSMYCEACNTCECDCHLSPSDYPDLLPHGVKNSDGGRRIRGKIILTLATVCFSFFILLIINVRAKNRLISDLREYHRLSQTVELLRLKVVAQEINARSVEVMEELRFAYSAYMSVGSQRLERIEICK